MSKSFKGTVENLKSSVWGHAVEVPGKLIAFYKKKDVSRFIASVNEGDEFHCAFIPNGKGKAYVLLNKELRKKLQVVAGDKVVVKIKPDESKYGMALPEEMEELFYQDPEGSEVFHSLTPGKQRSLLYMVGKPKSSQIRVKKAITIIEYLKYTQGQLDYKELNEAFKNSPY